MYKQKNNSAYCMSSEAVHTKVCGVGFFLYKYIYIHQ